MTRHEALLEEYASALRVAKGRAEQWWAELIVRIEGDVGSTDRAERAARWPDGPASHPWVIAVIRKYWLECEALNETIQREGGPPAQASEPEYFLADEETDDRSDEEASEEEAEIYPHVFVLEWLMTDEHDDLADFLGSLSYWPVGLDQNNRYT